MKLNEAFFILFCHLLTNHTKPTFHNHSKKKTSEKVNGLYNTVFFCTFESDLIIVCQSMSLPRPFSLKMTAKHST